MTKQQWRIQRDTRVLCNGTIKDASYHYLLSIHLHFNNMSRFYVRHSMFDAKIAYFDVAKHDVKHSLAAVPAKKVLSS